ncbi:MAG: hypothetical protein Q8Q09_12790 [Deltaproteobacteria bacterium]|nr:hypothetical protein [Deltaproteobacteria bacterium]
MIRLHRIFDEVLASSRPPDATAPPVRRFLDTAIEGISRAFMANQDDNILRREAIEILAQSKDPRALEALMSALSFRPGNADSERIALRSAQALKEMAASMPADKKSVVVQSLVAAIDRATGNGSNAVQIRYHALGALGALHAVEAVLPISRLLGRRLADQDISTARAAADALGQIGDARAVDALVYGLFLNVRAQNAFPHCQRALARVGSAVAVPKLLSTLAGQNTQVDALLADYRNIPNGPPIPDGLVKSTMADVLREFSSPDAVEPLLAILNNTSEAENVRGAAAEALAFTAMSVPASRDGILRALHTAYSRDRNPSQETGWSALTFASKLSLVGDPSSIPLLLTAINHRSIQSLEYATARVSLLNAFASIARHGNVAEFDRIEGEIRRLFTSAMAEDPGSAREIRGQITVLDKLRAVVDVVRTCEDADTACYIRSLESSSPESVRKAAYMLAWTTPEAQRGAARTALEGKLNHNDVLVRRSIMVALDALAPTGAPSTITRIQAVIAAEEGQESKILSHLWGELLIGRLRARTGS